MFSDGAVDCHWKPLGEGRWWCPVCKRPFSERVRRDTPPPPRNCTDNVPCEYLGAPVGTQECQGCRGTVRIKLFACEVHGQCTLGKRLDMLACCAQCGDYAPSKRDEDPDGGKAG